MKYQYFYQTSDNVNKDGFIRAKNRAEAYALLRKQGIKPYRLKGNDPINWQPWAVGGLFVFLFCSFAFVFYMWSSEPQEIEKFARRQQLVGEEMVLSRGVLNCWQDILPTKLDCYLAAYAQPGQMALPPEYSPQEIASFKDDLKVPMNFSSSDSESIMLLKRIVNSMRGEFSEYLNKGFSAEEYLKFLDERQEAEMNERKKYYEEVRNANEADKAKVLINVNLRLREKGMAEITL